ncbi:MAG: hypothetical protein ABIV36_12850, partial [Sphingobium limneticum]
SVGLQLEEHSADLFEFTADMYLEPSEVGELTPADPIGDGTSGVSDLTVAPATGSAAVAWRNPTSASFGYSNVYRGTTNVFTAATQIAGPIVGGLGQVQQITNTVAAGTYYYWVRAFDNDGVPADPTGPVSGIVT